MIKELLWQAPELLKGESNGGNGGNKTKEGDTYSYGIVLSEIITREDPYASYEMEPKGKVDELGRLLFEIYLHDFLNILHPICEEVLQKLSISINVIV